MIIKKFESFNSEIGAISKFISSMDDNNSIKFIEDILEISEKIDIPASCITGEYMSSRKSFLLESKNAPASDNYLKFWFSLSKGYLGKTISLKDSLSPLSSSILHSNRMLNSFQLEKVSNIYKTGKLEIVSDLETLKSGDRVIYIHNEGNDPVDGIIYLDKNNIYYILQDRFKPESTNVSKDLLNMLKKYNKSDYLKAQYGNFILKYIECDSEIYQDISTVDRLIIEKVKFINNNKICNNELRTRNWENFSYIQIKESDYSLVLDLGNLMNRTKLSSIISKRSDNKPLPINNDNYYRNTNIRNYEKKLKRSINSKENDRKIESIVNRVKMSMYGYRNIRDVDLTLLDKMVEICREGKISISQFEDMINKFF